MKTELPKQTRIFKNGDWWCLLKGTGENGLQEIWVCDNDGPKLRFLSELTEEELKRPLF